MSQLIGARGFLRQRHEKESLSTKTKKSRCKCRSSNERRVTKERLWRLSRPFLSIRKGRDKHPAKDLVVVSPGKEEELLQPGGRRVRCEWLGARIAGTDTRGSCSMKVSPPLAHEWGDKACSLEAGEQADTWTARGLFKDHWNLLV